jgi:hypothetical protein
MDLERVLTKAMGDRLAATSLPLPIAPWVARILKFYAAATTAEFARSEEYEA